MPFALQSIPLTHPPLSVASEVHLSPSLSFLFPHRAALNTPIWKPGDLQEGGRRAEGAPEFSNSELGTGGLGQSEKARTGVGGRGHLTTPLPVVQLPRPGADPPPTPRRASARVPIPQGRPASSVHTQGDQHLSLQLGVLLRSSHCPGERALTPAPGGPTCFPSTQREVRDVDDRSQRETGSGPRAPRVAGPPVLMTPQAMKCRGMASWGPLFPHQVQRQFPPSQTEKEALVAGSPAGRTPAIG